ncbi:nanos homolog 1-like [Emydura macquarii macquarii]|uniref:nanos homolog 1-like n=1 Tax=Emydura macquarii macquarii TaxID=1129001 RepID=UPI00352ACC38
MDCLERRCRDAAAFDFWTDYLGLSTLVRPARPPSAAPAAAPSAAPCACPCARPGCGAPGPAGPLRDLEERVALFRPFQPAGGGALRPGRGRASGGGCAAGLGLLGAQRRARPGAPGGRGRAKPEPRICVFCRNNGAPEEVFGSHVLKGLDGRVVCPVLRAYTCPLCSARGDNAHTVKYCPLSRQRHRHPHPERDPDPEPDPERPPQRVLKGRPAPACRSSPGRRLQIL